MKNVEPLYYHSSLKVLGNLNIQITDNSPTHMREKPLRYSCMFLKIS